MLTRIISALVALPLFFVVVYLLPPIWFTVAIAFVCIVAAYELLWRCHVVKHAGILIVSMLFAGAVPFWIYSGAETVYIMPAVFMLTIALFAVWVFGVNKLGLSALAIAVFSSFIIPLFFSATVGIILLEHGTLLLLTPFIAAWMTDTGAYFCGVLLGKHKLAPKISPKKTIEGAIGGVIVCVASFLIYGVVLEQFIKIPVSYLMLALLGLVLSVIAQIGDLSFSLIKREYNIKDYGNIIPGHGGVLDRFDSVVFTAPATYILLMWINAIK